MFVIESGRYSYELHANSGLFKKTVSCDTRNSVGMWLQKERTSDIDKFSLNLMCLSACIGNECMGNGIVITMTKQPMYDIFAPRNSKKPNVTKWSKRKENVKILLHLIL